MIIGFVVVFAFLMIFAAASPAFACLVKAETFSAGSIAPTISPGTVSVSDNTIHLSDKVIQMHYSGSPWGVGTASNTLSAELDSTSLTGPGTGHIVATFASAKAEGIVIFKYNGIGPYVYEGPTMTVGTYTATTGHTYVGILVSYEGVLYGRTDKGEGLVIKVEGTGVVLNSGYGINYDTDTYWTMW